MLLKPVQLSKISTLEYRTIVTSQNPAPSFVENVASLWLFVMFGYADVTFQQGDVLVMNDQANKHKDSALILEKL